MNRQLVWLAYLCALLITGCETHLSTGKLNAPPLSPSPYSRVGTITQVDRDAGTVVVKTDSRQTRLPEELLVRNSRLEIIAVLRPTGIRTGSSIGMVILSGDPRVGADVVQKTGN